MEKTKMFRVTEGHDHEATHTHRAVENFTVCDDTATYWA